eukprot:scaffold305_cov267-Chaetoceros_neogracile.AAC.43
MLLNSSELSSVRGLTSMTKKYKNVILEGLDHVYSECDTMLILTNQKKATICANNLIEKEQDGLQRLKDAASNFASDFEAAAASTKITPAFSKLSDVNKRMRKNKNKNKTRPSLPRQKQTKSHLPLASPIQRSFPYTEEQENDNIYHIDAKKSFTLPKPAATTVLGRQFPNQYTLRELVLLLDPFYNDGSMRLFKYLHSEKRVVISHMSYEKLALKYREQGELPDSGDMFLVRGRRNVLNHAEAIALSKTVDAKVNECHDAIEDVHRHVAKKQKGKDLLCNGVETIHPATARKYAVASIMLDETVHGVRSESPRIQSESRQVASHSLRTCLSQVVTAVQTQFIPGKWHNRPKDGNLSEGSLLMLKLAQDFFGCDVRPIDPRYLFNFDDTGRHHASGSWSSKIAGKRFRVSANGNNKKKRGSRSISRKAEPYDTVINGINTKFKVVVNADGRVGPIVLNFPIFTKEELSVPFHVIPVPGLAIGGDVNTSNLANVGYVILSCKGGKKENGGISPNELVTEWFYERIVQKFIIDVRESDDAAKWTRGSEVPINFRATTKLDGEKSMMSHLKKKHIQDMDAKNGNLVFKIAAAGTGCYQPLDLATLFKLLNEKMKMLTRNGNESDLSKSFRKILTSLRDQNIFLSLNKSKIDNIIGIVSVCPQVYQETFTRDRTQACFVTSGDLSKSVDGMELYGISDAYKIMGQCIVDWNPTYTHQTGRLWSSLREYFVSLIPRALEASRDYPRVVESWFDGRLDVDKREDGSDYIRDSGDLDYCLHRALIVHHKDNRKKLDEIMHREKERLKSKARMTYHKYEGFFSENEKCEQEIRKLAKIAPSDPITNVPIGVFLKRSVLAAWLRAFVMVRDNADITVSFKHLPTLKGSAGDLTEGHEHNLVKRAFDVQSKPKLANIEQLDHLRATMVEDTEAVAETAANADLPASLATVHPGEDSWQISSDFIRNSCIHFGTLADKDDDFKENAPNRLTTIDGDLISRKCLLPRYGSLLNDHGISSSHYTVHWMEQNMSRAASVLKLHGFMIEDNMLAYVGNSDSLFKAGMRCEEYKVGDGNERTNRIGAYLMKDSVRGKFIRGGSTAASFMKRQEGHTKASKLTSESDRDSRLYSLYPHETATDNNKNRSCETAVGAWSQ